MLLAMAAVIARSAMTSRPGFAIFLIVSVVHASALAPIVPIADAMTLAAAPAGRFQYGWVRGGASAAFIVGSVSAGQVIAARSLGGIIWMNGTLLALAAVAALWLPRLKCAGSALGGHGTPMSALCFAALRLLASYGAGEGLGYEQPRPARWL